MHTKETTTAGIGTYVETGSYAQKSRIGRIKSWWSKAKDQAVGHSYVLARCAIWLGVTTDSDQFPGALHGSLPIPDAILQ